MEVLLEVFQEAVVRLPNKLAGAASMVGALVIGTTIVQAEIINPVLVVVIATTAIASYSMPSLNFSWHCAGLEYQCWFYLQYWAYMVSYWGF